ncbi:hypothetical protein GCM10022234_11050 [Aeromicrobium panaciterrae]|uniref:hypothetical protein n=1 Tax=Aeromicrobium panaciterrae TaxID=363861 RepID=UPI0031D87B95
MGRPYEIRANEGYATAMMRDDAAHHFDDPARRWSSLLQGIHGQRREAVIKALRNSVDSGYPATAEGVRILVAYAQGQISARQYVTQTLESLGFLPAAYAPASSERQQGSWRQTPSVRRAAPWDDERSASRRPQAAAPALLDFNESRVESRESERFSTTITQSRRNTRHEVVQAYVNGQIPVEEFLRLQRGR